jgi:hypothetical protein
MGRRITGTGAEWACSNWREFYPPAAAITPSETAPVASASPHWSAPAQRCYEGVPPGGPLYRWLHFLGNNVAQNLLRSCFQTVFGSHTLNMKKFATRALVSGALVSATGVALALPLGGQVCTATPNATVTVPAPGSGSITSEALSRFNYPAQVCVTMGFAGTSISFDYAAALAVRFNNTSFPSACAGVPFGLNGGPIYSYTSGKGNFGFNPTNPTAAVTGTLQATSYSITENLTLSAGGSSFVINTGLMSFKSLVTINADQSTDVKICTPRGGVPAQVNGNPLNIPTPIWQCLAQPTQTQPNVRVVYEEGC